MFPFVSVHFSHPFSQVKRVGSRKDGFLSVHPLIATHPPPIPKSTPLPNITSSIPHSHPSTHHPAHLKEGYLFSRLRPGCHLPDSPWSGIIKIFPARGNLVSDIPSGEGKMRPFLQCTMPKSQPTLPTNPSPYPNSHSLHPPPPHDLCSPVPASEAP
jgi:hypothetical protein